MTVCVVTGAAAGIGRAIADRVLADGWAVIAVDVDGSGLDSLVQDHPGGQVRSVVGDVADPATSAEAAVVADQLGILGGWVNNAAVYAPGSAHDVAPADIRRQIDVNLIGAMFGASEATRRFLPRGSGSIINVSSIQSIAAFPRSLVYASTKGGLNALTRQMAVEYAPFGIRVNAVMPGSIRTPMSITGWQETEDPVAAERADALLHPVRRMGEPEDVAAVVSFLLSPDASFVTGQCIAVDGGASARVIAYDPDPDLADRFGIRGQS
ncbi:MAG: SDR family oxidoreductase [Chloroflexi bacterium]|nr:SDR family oxidoreductase [Chloroflexota bacterium]